MPELTFNYDDLWYIRTRGEDDKRPLDSWGGYSQDFETADEVYSHGDLEKMPGGNWAICGIRDQPHMSRALFVVDLDIHKAGADFDMNAITIDDSVPLVKSQSGGFHAYGFIINEDRGAANESDFHVPHDLDWDVDMRGSYVNHHVVAPAEIPGVDGTYTLTNDETIPGFASVDDMLERIQYNGDPLVEYDPDGGKSADLEFNRPDDAPEEFPTCYANGLALREAAPEGPDYNSHQVNVLTALCGLAAGFPAEDVAKHFAEDYPPEGDATVSDREKTEYQVEHIARKLDNGEYSPPALSTLENAGILDSEETCDCRIDYHGGSDDETGLSDEEVWEWWSDARMDGQLGTDAIIPDAALRHIAREHTSYDYSDVPEDKDSVPWVPAWKAFYWLKYQWAPDALGIDPTDDDAPDVTARETPEPDRDDVHGWEGVRYTYEHMGAADGRYAAVNLLRRHHDFLTPEDTEELHVYVPERGVYEKGARYDIGRKLDRNLEKYYTTHEKREILTRLREVTVERDELEAARMDGTYVCVENGVLDIDERELLDHDPKWLFTRRLPVTYDPDATCPRTRDFLEDITRREEDWRTMVQMLGNTLLPNYNFESFLVLFGRGSNGKSTWYNVCRTFLGSDNVENIPLHTLTEDDYAASNLLGKWANIGGDLPQTKIHDLGTLKDLTGGGEIWTQPKGKQGFNFANRAKMMFAANQPPVLGERSHAIARRILPIRLPHRYTPQDDDHKDVIPGLEDELTTGEELSGLLNLVLDELEALRETGDFALPEPPAERLEYYEQFSDHIKMFAVNCLANEAGEQEAKADIYNAYTAYCEEKGRTSVGQQTFWRKLRQTTLDISIIRPYNEDGTRHRVADNLTFTDHGRQFAPNYETDDHDVPKLSEIAPGDEHVTVEGRIANVTDDTPDSIAQKATLVDVTDQVQIVVWSDSNKPDLAVEAAYRFKNVNVTEYDGQVQVQVDHNSGVQELSDGVGNVPAADPGANQQLDATADGGQATPAATEDDIEEARAYVKKAVQDNERDYDEGVPHALVLGEVVQEGFESGAVEHAIEKLLTNGEIHEPRTDHYRTT